jgi:hypothetical protein
MLYTLLWQHVPTYFGHLQTINTTLISVLYTRVFHCKNNSYLPSTNKPIHATVSDIILQYFKLGLEH